MKAAERGNDSGSGNCIESAGELDAGSRQPTFEATGARTAPGPERSGNGNGIVCQQSCAGR